MTNSILWAEYPIGDHRIVCPGCGTNPRKKDMGLTVLAADHGIAHCFKCGMVTNNRNTRELTPAERLAFTRRMETLRRQHDAEQKQRQAEAATESALRWAAAGPADEQHQYLATKCVKAYGLKSEGAALLIPLRDTTGVLHSLQTIAPNGSKRFASGGRIKGCYHAIGRVSGKVLICEGYATGATIHEHTGHAVAVAFNSGNLLPVALALRGKFPCIDVVLCADDDHATAGNPGLTAATEAARAVGGLLAVPDFSGLARGPRDSDFNDLARLAGRVEVNP